MLYSTIDTKQEVQEKKTTNLPLLNVKYSSSIFHPHEPETTSN